MMLDLRFAVVSDLHIGLPHTLYDHPTRFHLIEVSIPALENVFQHLSQLDLDFLLLPGDLTQHGEPENHIWLRNRLRGCLKSLISSLAQKRSPLIPLKKGDFVLSYLSLAREAGNSRNQGEELLVLPPF
jgi:3',5'-cyclic AMP phosphodiesterase CpdA